MAPLDVIVYGHPVLREPARTIERITDHHRQFASELTETMYENQGIGLAANQVGSTQRVVVIDTEWPDREELNEQPVRQPVVMFNPEILEESAEDEDASEGCLSLPGITGTVWRSRRIRFSYTDLEGRRVERDVAGWLARCVQHELDHLNGVLFIDRMPAEERRQIAGQLAVLRRGEQATGSD